MILTKKKGTLNTLKPMMMFLAELEQRFWASSSNTVFLPSNSAFHPLTLFGGQLAWSFVIHQIHYPTMTVFEQTNSCRPGSLNKNINTPQNRKLSFLNSTALHTVLHIINVFFFTLLPYLACGNFFSSIQPCLLVNCCFEHRTTNAPFKTLCFFFQYCLRVACEVLNH